MEGYLDGKINTYVNHIDLFFNIFDQEFIHSTNTLSQT